MNEGWGQDGQTTRVRNIYRIGRKGREILYRSELSRSFVIVICTTSCGLSCVYRREDGYI